mgnify:CR=1 FL=1|jgi:hypothetical protein
MRAPRFMPGRGAALLGITPDGMYVEDRASLFTTTRHKDDVDNAEWKILDARVWLDK